jgi:glyoxylase-like metal-dependent hydrolase (beta-lactamase superfamily II)
VKELADGVWQLPGLAPNVINAYLIGDVLVDAQTRHSGGRILRELRGHDVRAHALTHAHADHQGASHEVCEALEIPFWAPEREVAVAEDSSRLPEIYPDHPLGRFFIRIFRGPGHPVERPLREGDEVAGFEVIDAPGHSPGEIVFWRESDRVLIIGDVLANMDQITGLPGLNEPKTYLSTDPEENRASIRKLAPLEPELVCFGHGRPLRDPRKFVSFIEGIS